MKQNMAYTEAGELLLERVHPMPVQEISLEEAGGRILAQDLKAAENVPPFDRSPYDGYAVRAEDTAAASEEQPAVLRILEEVPAGSVPHCEVIAGTAVKILTGAPIPKGADAVIMFEKTEFTPETVTLFGPMKSGENILRAGEDVKQGQILAEAGTVIDPGLAGTLASQGTARPVVYRKPKAAVISTGSELVEAADEVLPPGKIRNSNRYTFTTVLQKDGCEVQYYGTPGDCTESIAALITKGLKECDLVLLTGGVSVGDYDLTPAAMELAGCEILVRGVDLKPGMACCYGVCGGKLVCGLSGNPSSSLINYYAVLQPVIRKLAGRKDYGTEYFTVELAEGFGKKFKGVRLLKGRLAIEDGRAVMHLPKGQGNVMISSSIGCDVMAVVPAGSGPLEPGAKLQAFKCQNV